MNYEDVRGALRQARSRAGLTLDEAAEKTGLNRATIHSLENVKREPTLQPELDTMERLAEAYGGRLSVVYRHTTDPLPVSSMVDSTGVPLPPVVTDDFETPSAEEQKLIKAFARLVAREGKKLDTALTRPRADPRAAKPKVVTHDRGHARPARKRSQRARRRRKR